MAQKTQHPVLAPVCAECGGKLIPGLNTDFCSQDCEETWTTAHTWPCQECDDEGMVDGFVRGRRIRDNCPHCHGEMTYVDCDRRHCSTEGCKAEAQAGQDFCGAHLAGIYAVSSGEGHCHGR